MSNAKISALTSATTPLAGTETLPIVQSGATKQVSVANLTAGRAVSAASLDLTTTPLPVSSGGTGLSTVTSGYIPFGDTASALSTDANLSWDNTNKKMFIKGTTALTWGAGSGGAFSYGSTTLGTAGTGGSLFINTPSLNSTYNSGFGVDGTYSGGKSTINIKAFGVYSAGPYSCDIAFYTTTTTTSTQQLLLSNTGNLTLNTGNLVIGTSGKGIDFSATAGTGTSELLADYEEGTFTPTIAGSTVAGTGTYAAQIGRYTKIGRTVIFNIDLEWTNLTGATGSLIVGGLPFTPLNLANNVQAVSSICNNVALTAGYVMQNIILPNSAYVYLRQTPTGGGAFATIALDTAGTLYITGSYEV